MKKWLLSILAGYYLCTGSAVGANSVNAKTYYLPQLQQEAQHKIAIQRIVGRLQTSHYVRFTLDDAFSNQIFNNYLEVLDPQKKLFLESNFLQFSTKKNELDDELSNRDLTIAYELFRISQQKLAEQYLFSLDLLQTLLPLDGEDRLVVDRKKSKWPSSQQAQQELWTQLLKDEVISLMISNKSWPQAKDILTKRYTGLLKQLRLTNSEDVFSLFINAFITTLDPHTNYLSSKDTADFISSMNLSLEGIGATIESDNEFIRIVGLVPNGPADKHRSVLVGDKIVGVAQGNQVMVDVVGWRLDDVVALIKGPKGSRVRLELIPSKGKKTKIVTLVRDEIKFEDSKAKITIEYNKGNKIAVLAIPSFYFGVASDSERLLRDLSDMHPDVTGIIVDLRANGGGILSEVVELSTLFLPSPESIILQVKMSDGRIAVYSKNNVLDEELEQYRLSPIMENNVFYYKKPMVVLIDRLSVSASEIFAAAMQDYGRAVILGEQTFGKGTVQNGNPLTRIFDTVLYPGMKSLGSLRYTNKKFYRVTGHSTQLRGVIPDLVMKTQYELIEIGEKYEKNALPWDRISQANYAKVLPMHKWLSELNKRHVARLRKDEDYQFILERLSRNKTYYGNMKSVSLNLATRQKEAQEDERFVLNYANKKLLENNKKMISSLDELPRDFDYTDVYLNEAIKVVADLFEISHN